jgi:uncharacterized membrane protein
MGKDKIKVILVLALAAILRLINLNQSFWLDEGAQVLMSSKSLHFQWFGRTTGEFHPPLFYILIHFWLKLGKSEWFLRLPSVIFGVATVYFVFLVGKRLFNEKLGILSAFFLAISQYHVYYSQEVRMYSLAALLATASTFFLLGGKWFFYFLTITALLYSHYLGAFIFFPHAIWILFFQRKVFKYWFYSIVFSFLVFFPWLSQFFKQLKSGLNLVEILPGWANVSSLAPAKVFPLTFIKFSLGRISFYNKTFYAAISLIIFLIYGFLFYQTFRKIQKQGLFLWGWFLIPLFLGFIISFFLPLFQPFRFLFTIVPFYLLLALGILAFKKSWQKIFVGIIIFISLSSLFLYFSQARLQREDWRAATTFIESQDPKNSVAIFEFSQPFAPYQWYSQGEVKAYGVLPGLKAKPEVVNQKMFEVTAGVDNVFLFQYLQPLTDPDHLVEGWLQKNGFKEKEIKDFSGVGFVYNYIRK